MPLSLNTDKSKNMEVSFYHKKLDEKTNSPSEINNFMKVDYPQPEFGKFFFQDENIPISKERSLQDDSKRAILQKIH